MFAGVFDQVERKEIDRKKEKKKKEELIRGDGKPRRDERNQEKTVRTVNLQRHITC
jgi:hypothetical protein